MNVLGALPRAFPPPEHSRIFPRYNAREIIIRDYYPFILSPYPFSLALLSGTAAGEGAEGCQRRLTATILQPLGDFSMSNFCSERVDKYKDKGIFLIELCGI